MIEVEVVYAEMQRSLVKRLQLAAGARVSDALAALQHEPKFAGIDFNAAAVGIYGRVVAREVLLKSGDRLEIYRPLQQDPKQARRQRVSKRGRS